MPCVAWFRAWVFLRLGKVFKLLMGRLKLIRWFVCVGGMMVLYQIWTPKILFHKSIKVNWVSLQRLKTLRPHAILVIQVQVCGCGCRRVGVCKCASVCVCACFGMLYRSLPLILKVFRFPLMIFNAEVSWCAHEYQIRVTMNHRLWTKLSGATLSNEAMHQGGKHTHQPPIPKPSTHPSPCTPHSSPV